MITIIIVFTLIFNPVAAETQHAPKVNVMYARETCGTLDYHNWQVEV